jgi:hypothetical protein
VDDASYTGDLDTSDLDFDAARTRDDLAALLYTAYIRADKPSLRTLEARTRHGATPLSKTAVAEMLRGVRFPRKAVMIAFLGACGVQDDGMESWRRAWERIASSEYGPARHVVTQPAPGRRGQAAAAAQHPQRVARETERETRVQRADADHSPAESTASADPTEINQLREQVNRLTQANEQFRSQLAVKQGQAADESRPDNVTSGQEARSSVIRQSM